MVIRIRVITGSKVWCFVGEVPFKHEKKKKKKRRERIIKETNIAKKPSMFHDHAKYNNYGLLVGTQHYYICMIIVYDCSNSFTQKKRGKKKEPTHDCRKA